MPPPLKPSSSMDVRSIVSHWRENWVPSVLQAVLHLYCAWAWIKCLTLQPTSSLRCWELLPIFLVLGGKARWFSSKISIATFCFVFVFFKFCSSLSICINFSDNFTQCILTISPLKLLVYPLYTLNSWPVLGFLTSAYPCLFVKAVSPIYTRECCLLWSVVTLPESCH